MHSIPTEAQATRRRVKPPSTAEKGRGEAPVRRNIHSITLSPMKKQTGRTSKLLDKSRMNRLYDALIAGNTILTACAMAGISEPTYYRWLREAKIAPEGHQLREFRQSLKRAMAIAEHRNVVFIQKAASEHWQAAAWWLERRYPKDWGRIKRVKPGGDAPPILNAHPAKKTLSSGEGLRAMKNLVKRLSSSKT